jgi:hypothetical protein
MVVDSVGRVMEVAGVVGKPPPMTAAAVAPTAWYPAGPFVADVADVVAGLVLGVTEPAAEEEFTVAGTLALIPKQLNQQPLESYVVRFSGKDSVQAQSSNPLSLFSFGSKGKGWASGFG